MKNKCPGSGKKPKYPDTKYPEMGACPSCPSSRRLRKDGRLPAHQPSPKYNAAVTAIAKMFVR